MSTMLTKSAPVVVRPSEPTPTGSIDLSSFDKGIDGLSVTTFLVFDHPIHEAAAQCVKRALSQALVLYHPIAGRLTEATNEADVQRIECTGEGVIFVAATVNCTLKNASFMTQPFTAAFATELSLCSSPEEVSHRKHCSSDPLLLMQVTEFSCGGFVISVTWNHAIADAEGMAQFLQAVAELTRGGMMPSLTVIPIRRDTSLPELSPSIIEARHRIERSVGIFHQMAVVDITIPWSAIGSIKSEYSRFSGDGGTCTVFDVVVAVLWQCRARATMSDPDAFAPLFFVANMRKLTGAKDGYYGNCHAPQVVPATSGALAGSPLMEIVKVVKGVKEQVSTMYQNGVVGVVESPISLDQVSDEMLCGYNTLLISSWRNLGLDAADFGGGRPVRVIGHVKGKSPSCVLCPPSMVNGGANVLTQFLKEEHVSGFLEELAKFT